MGPTQSTTITIRVTDNGSPALSDFETINVTVNNVAPIITTPLVLPASPVAMGTNFSMTWTFTDPGSDSWTCKISWDQPVVLGTGFASSGPGNKTCSISGSGLPAGVYTVTVYVEDDDGDSDQETATAYIVVYDPNGGFVTGGGWINSPAGCLPSRSGSCTGKANFGFVSKYQQGKSLPHGNTEFQFHAGNLNFKSTVYEWLVVAGTKAQYKGEGTIDGLPALRLPPHGHRWLARQVPDQDLGEVYPTSSCTTRFRLGQPMMQIRQRR